MRLPNVKIFLRSYTKDFSTAFILLMYILLSLVITYPLILNIRNSVIGIAAGGQLWNFWWFKTTIFELHKFPLPYIHHTDLIYYPYGQSLYILDPLNSLLSIPLQIIFNLPISYNLIIIFNFILGCFAAYLLIKYLTNNRLAGFVSGIIYGCSPYLLSSINNSWSEAVNIGWIPLCVLYLYKLLRENKKRDILITALLLFLVTFSCWYYGMYICIFTALFFVSYSFSFGKTGSWKAKKSRLILNKRYMFKLTMAIVLFVVMIYPFAHYFQKSIESLEASEFRGQRHSFRKELLGTGTVDLICYFHPGKFYSPDFKIARGPSKDFITVVYVGYTVLLLALLGSFICKKGKRFWLFSLFFFFLLSLGPYLYINGRVLTILGRPMPLLYLFMYKHIPFFYQMKTAFRFNNMVMLSLSVLAGYGLMRIFDKVKDKNKFKISMLIAGCIILEFLFLSPAKYPIPSQPSSIPNWYHTLAKEKDDFAIIDLPIGDFMSLRKYLYFQTIHQKKIPYSFYLFEMKRLFKHNVFLLYLKNLFWNITTEIPPLELSGNFNFNDALEELQSFKFKYIVVHNNLIENKDTNEKTHQFLSEFLGRPKNYQDNIMVYRIY